MPNDKDTVMDFSHAGLLIAAHGSTSAPGGRTSSRKLADTIRALDLFGDVRAGFLTQKPFVKNVLDDMKVAEVFVVPNLACAGYVSSIKLPTALYLTGAVTERISPNGRQRVYLTDPVGTDPALGKTMAIRIGATMQNLSMPPQDTCVVVIGHGSQKTRESFEHTQRITADISRQGLDVEIITAYLEEQPFIKDWRNLTNAKNVVFAPFLISDGYHGSNEIPQHIGFDAKAEDFIAKLSSIEPNELISDGRRLIYLPPIGDAPEMAELILKRVRAAQAQSA
ncbi:MAG: hypothetical protein JKY27_08465 [Magnetovibrio sp.]|nr:hypothetical protein [Magnetovibrio sp.]